MLKRIMKRAHELAKKMKGDYQARLSLALKLAWKEKRGNNKMEWNGYEVRITSGLNFDELKTTDKNRVYETIDEDGYCVSNKDELVAKDLERVFVKYFEGKVWFFGDTYNKKEKIKELAEKFNAKANWTGNYWEIDTEDIVSDEDFVSFLEEVKNKYDYSYSTNEEIKMEIKDFS